MIPLIARILFISILVTFVPFVGVNFFDAPVMHRFVSFDVLFVSLLFLQKGRLIWQLLFSISAFCFAFWENTTVSYLTGFSYLGLVWIFYWLRNLFKVKAFLWFVLVLFIIIADWSLFFESTFDMSLYDLFGLAKFYWWGIALFFTIPFLQLGITGYFFRTTLKEAVKLSLWVIYSILALFLGFNMFFEKIQPRITFLDFSLYSFLEQQLQLGRISHNVYLQADIKNHFKIIYPEELRLDSIRPTVMILVESWGVRKNFSLNDSDFNLFPKKRVSLFGIRERMTSYTQGAEWEDFRTPAGKGPSGVFSHYKEENYQIWYLHGYDENFYDRKTNYPSLGFDSLKFKESFENENFPTCNYGFKGICDSTIVLYIDSMLSCSTNKFIYWTTLDSHPPYEMQKSISTDFCQQQNLSKIECIHTTRIRNSLKHIAKLIEKHPEYRFIIQGDHRPMGSLAAHDFVQSFYYRWVPIIVLNEK